MKKHIIHSQMAMEQTQAVRKPQAKHNSNN
jgi:hypothetical protein